MVTTDENPHSSRVSDEPVNITSPYSNKFCFSPSEIFTFSLTSIRSDGLEYTFLYVINFALPSTKSSLVFPVNPPKNLPNSPRVLYSTPSVQSSCINASSLVIWVLSCRYPYFCQIHIRKRLTVFNLKGCNFIVNKFNFSYSLRI